MLTVYHWLVTSRGSKDHLRRETVNHTTRYGHMVQEFKSPPWEKIQTLNHGPDCPLCQTLLFPFGILVNRICFSNGRPSCKDPHVEGPSLRNSRLYETCFRAGESSARRALWNWRLSRMDSAKGIAPLYERPWPLLKQASRRHSQDVGIVSSSSLSQFQPVWLVNKCHWCLLRMKYTLRNKWRVMVFVV